MTIYPLGISILSLLHSSSASRAGFNQLCAEFDFPITHLRAILRRFFDPPVMIGRLQNSV